VNRRRALWVAGAAAVAGSAIAAGKIMARRERRGPDGEAGERFDELPPEEIAPVVSPDGTLLRVRAAGHPDRPALVFSHGFSVDMTTWHYQWKDLSAEYRCVLFDHRGHGGSGKAAGGDHTLQAMGRDIKAVIDAAVHPDQPVIVVGHSMGGRAILGLAETHPELFGERVVGAVFADTAAAELVRGAAGAIGTRLLALAPSLGRRFGRRLGSTRLRMRLGASDLAYLVGRVTNFGPGASPSMVEYVVDLSMRSPIEVWTDGIAGLVEMDLRHAIQHVRCPSLVVVGDLDRLTPPASAMAIKDALPDGRLVVLEGAGHMAPMERHEQFNGVVRRFVGAVLSARATEAAR